MTPDAESLAGFKVRNAFDLRLPQKVLRYPEPGKHSQIARSQGCNRICFVLDHRHDAEALRFHLCAVCNVGGSHSSTAKSDRIGNVSGCPPSGGAEVAPVNASIGSTLRPYLAVNCACFRQRTTRTLSTGLRPDDAL